MATLTVGAGLDFSTIRSAIAASHDGDVLNIKSGVYTNDFSQINDSITLQAIGGPVTLKATVAPGNGKGIFVIGDAAHSPDVTINGLTFTGAKIARSAGNNGAGIRYQSGNLTLLNDKFTNNQDGILATPYVAGTGTITVSHSTFANNGAGDGYSHNLYIGYVDSFTFQYSTSTGAIAGHDIKSRALNTVIEGSTITSGTGGTTSYEIDLPNGGNARVTGNLIQQGALSHNPNMIAYGEEGNLHPGSLVVAGNSFVNTLPVAFATAVHNWSTVDALLNGNSFYGIGAAYQLTGPGTIAGSQVLAPLVLAPCTLASNGAVLAMPAAGIASVLVTGNDDTVHLNADGGTVVATGARATISSVVGAIDSITLQNTGTVNSFGIDTIAVSGATDTVTAHGPGSVVSTTGSGTHLVTLLNTGTVISAGHDTIMLGPFASKVTASGPGTTIKTQGSTQHVVTLSNTGTVISTGADKVTLGNFANAVTATGANASITTVGPAAHAITLSNSGAVTSTGSDTVILKAGVVAITAQGTASVTANGAQVTIQGAAGSSTTVQGGTGNLRYLGSGGSLAFIGGTGTSTITAGAGAADIQFGAGATTLVAGSGAEMLRFVAGAGGGSDIISGFNAALDTIAFTGFAGPAVLSQSVSAGSLQVTLTDNTRITFLNTTSVSLPT